MILGVYFKNLLLGSYSYSPGGMLEAHGRWIDPNFPSATGYDDTEELLKENLAEAMNESSVKESHEMSRDLDALSTSSESSRSTSRGRSYSARSSPPHGQEHVIIFPSSRGSPDSN